jgi:hypothetical protein
MVTTDNLELVRKEHGYVVGLQRRRREAVYQYIERIRDGVRIPANVITHSGDVISHFGHCDHGARSERSDAGRNAIGPRSWPPSSC